MSKPNLGILTRREALQYQTSLLWSNLCASWVSKCSQWGLKSFASVDLGTIQVPDSTLAKNALEEAKESYTGTLLFHCLRTYYWACGLAMSEKLQYDRELLYVASVLHDIGLSESHKTCCAQQCFAHYGGDYAARLMSGQGMSNEAAHQLKSCIDLHLNPRVDRVKDGVESYVLSKAAAMDVIGIHAFQLGQTFLKEVQRKHPRTNFKNEIVATMRDYNHKRNTRADLLHRMGFGRMAVNNPLDHKDLNLF